MNTDIVAFDDIFSAIFTYSPDHWFGDDVANVMSATIHGVVYDRPSLTDFLGTEGRERKAYDALGEKKSKY